MGGGGGKGGGGGDSSALMGMMMQQQQMQQAMSIQQSQVSAAQTQSMLDQINESAVTMPKAPDATPTPAPEGAAGESGATAADDTARKLAASKILGRSSTILTGATGDDTTANTRKKALLGQ
jgi:membrane protease subunit (stomatin/prohibitin family)